jgi:hypothetical protein
LLKASDTFINKNLKQNGTIIIGFPHYLQGASQEKIDEQRRLTELLLGHSHPPDEFFTVEEFSSAFGTQPVSFYQRHMYLTPDKPDDTVLISNVAVFNIHRPIY